MITAQNSRRGRPPFDLACFCGSEALCRFVVGSIDRESGSHQVREAAPQWCARSSFVTQSAICNIGPKGPSTFVQTRALRRLHHDVPIPYLGGTAVPRDDPRAAGFAEAHADVVHKVLKLAQDSDYTGFLKHKLVEWYQA